MRSRLWIILIFTAIVLVVAATLQYTLTKQRNAAYEIQLAEIWSKANANLRILDKVVQTKDFSAVSTTAKGLCQSFDDAEKQLFAIVPPKRHKEFHNNLVGYLDLSASLSNAIKNSCDCWRSANFRSHEVEITALNNARSTCFNSWRGSRSLEQSTDVFDSLPKRFNEMRVAQKSKEKEANAPRVIVIPVAGRAGPDPPWPAESYGSVGSYLNQMRPLIVRYKRLRGDLEGTIQWVKTHKGQVPGSQFTSSIDRAKLARENIRDEMKGLYVPDSWRYCHDEAVGCVDRGIQAIDWLKAGNSGAFSAVSNANTPKLREVMRAYDLS